jgi:hypothetical protein
VARVRWRRSVLDGVGTLHPTTPVDVTRMFNEAGEHLAPATSVHAPAADELILGPLETGRLLRPPSSVARGTHAVYELRHELGHVDRPYRATPTDGPGTFLLNEAHVDALARQDPRLPSMADALGQRFDAQALDRDPMYSQARERLDTLLSAAGVTPQSPEATRFLETRDTQQLATDLSTRIASRVRSTPEKVRSDIDGRYLLGNLALDALANRASMVARPG